MSDTPRTDAAFAEHGKITFQGEQYVMAEFAHTLERENAALRADKERMDWLERYGPWDRWIDPDGPDITLRKPIRDCIDAARKEAQQ